MTSFFQETFRLMPLIGIFRGVKPEDVVEVAVAAAEQGIRIIEVPLNSPEPLVSIQRLSRHFGETLLVGAGTVTKAAEARAVAEAGGKLVVTPYARCEVVRAAKEQGMITIPGAMTPTEVAALADCGADAIKLFPAEMIPPRAVRAMRAVLPARLPLVMVGGITRENMGSYLQAGADGFGLGANLYRAGDSSLQVATRASALVQCLQDLRRT